MSVTDPFTGNLIEPGAQIVRCRHGHINLPNSWAAAGNRCAYPGCDQRGEPLASTLPLSEPANINVLDAGSRMVPLDIRVLSTQSVHASRWPLFRSSFSYALLTMLTFLAVFTIGWLIVLSNASVPVEMIWSYVPLNDTLLLFAGIAVILSALILTVLRQR